MTFNYIKKAKNIDLFKFYSENVSKFISLAFRVGALAGKFLIFFIIQKHLTVEDVGVYGLFTSSIAWSIYLLGFDFYTYSTREIIISSANKVGSLIKDQGVFYSLTYLVVLPCLLFLFGFDFLPSDLVIYFFSLLIIEHLSIEGYRILVSLERHVLANTFLFIKSGLWVFLVLTLDFFDVYRFNSLNEILSIWLFFGVISLFGTLTTVLYKNTTFRKTDTKWILSGFRTSSKFFANTVCLLVIQFSDRYFLDYFRSTKEAGIFIFYNNIANGLEVLVYTLAIMSEYPKLMKAFHNGEIKAFSAKYNSFKKNVFLYSLLGAFSILILIFAVQKSLKPIYQEHLYLLILCLLNVIVLCFSQAPHYFLYIKKQDNIILKITLAATIVSLLSNVLLIYYLGIIGACLAGLFSYSFIYFCKKSYVK